MSPTERVSRTPTEDGPSSVRSRAGNDRITLIELPGDIVVFCRVPDPRTGIVQELADRWAEAALLVSAAAIWLVAVTVAETRRSKAREKLDPLLDMVRDLADANPSESGTYEVDVLVGQAHEKEVAAIVEAILAWFDDNSRLIDDRLAETMAGLLECLSIPGQPINRLRVKRHLAFVRRAARSGIKKGEVWRIVDGVLARLQQILLGGP
jgi:hypothetical protein